MPSPCIRVCRMNPGTGWCEGCLRTLAEIGSWMAMSPAERCAVLARVRQRRLRMEAP